MVTWIQCALDLRLWTFNWAIMQSVAALWLSNQETEKALGSSFKAVVKIASDGGSE